MKRPFWLGHIPRGCVVERGAVQDTKDKRPMFSTPMPQNQGLDDLSPD